MKQKYEDFSLSVTTFFFSFNLNDDIYEKHRMNQIECIILAKNRTE